MVLGRATYEQDAYKIRPLLMERGRLTRASAASATTIYINSLPRGVAGYGGFAVIDPWSTECEVRLITNRAGKILTLASALTYAHSKYDEVMFIDRPWINALWFTAVGDDSTNNTAGDSPFARWGAQAAAVHGVAYLPVGTYQYAAKLDWTTSAYDGVSLVGDGKYSILKATTTMRMLEIDLGNTAAGAVLRNGFVRDVWFDGNSVANIGIIFGKAVLYNTHNVKIYGVTGTPGTGMILDRSQNQLHTNLHINACDNALVVQNGAANNVFDNPHLTSANTYGLWLKEDATYPGYDAEDTNSGNQNSFRSGIVEPGSTTGTTAMVYLQHAQRNLFDRMDFVRPATGNTILIDISTDSPYNTFQGRCRMNAYNNAYEPLVRNSGDGTLIRDCSFTDPPSAMDAIQTGDGWMEVVNNDFATDFVPINVTSGLIYGRVRRAVASRTAGATADRPELGSAIGVPFYDITLGKPIWSSAAGVWVDATGATV